MNKVFLMGRLTKDPELRYTSSNNLAVCQFTLAVDRKFTKQGEERQADFIPVVMWNKAAEIVAKYCQKGRQIVVIGRMQPRTWDDAEGKRHYITEVIADDFYFADSKRSDDASQRFDSTPGVEQSDGFFAGENESDELPF